MRYCLTCQPTAQRRRVSAIYPLAPVLKLVQPSGQSLGHPVLSRSDMSGRLPDMPPPATRLQEGGKHLFLDYGVSY